MRIDAANEKAGRGDVLPLPPDVADLLRPWLAGKPSEGPLWPGKWAEQKRAGKIMQADLKAAHDVWLKEAEHDADLHAEREQSDFLAYRDHDGRYADFHSLRHCYLSRLGRSGAPAKVMQRLARHSDVNLTLGRYTHAELFDLSAAVERLPALPVTPAPSTEPQTLRATGTAGDPMVAVVAGMVAGPVANSCVRLMPADETDTPDVASS